VLQLWTVYENPRDYPGKFVARLFLNDEPTQIHHVAATLWQLLEMIPENLVRIPRDPQDDPCILEVWI
jgi:hypothetical protein